MTLLDRYTAKQYLTNIVLLFVLLFAIILGIDFSLQFDEYTRAAGEVVLANEREALTLAGVAATEIAARTKEISGLGQRLEALWQAVLLAFDLWWPRLFVLYNYLLGLVLVGAAGFTLAQMVRHRELVAIIAGGISLSRLARPILAVAVCLTVLQGLNRELVVPRFAELLTREKRDVGKTQLDRIPLNLLGDSRGRLFYARAFDPSTGTIDNPLILERDENGLLVRKIIATRATWDPKAPRTTIGGWVLFDGVAEFRGPTGQLREPVQVVESDLDPTTIRLRRFDGYRQNLSVASLSSLMQRYREEGAAPEKIDALDRVRFARFGVMFSNILALIICLPFYLTREPKNMLLRTIYVAPIALVTLLGATIGATAIIPALPPMVSAFIPTLILAPVAIAAAGSVRS
jgi:lipopolysaccharide export system permease protein